MFSWVIALIGDTGCGSGGMLLSEPIKLAREESYDQIETHANFQTKKSSFCHNLHVLRDINRRNHLIHVGISL